MLGLSLLLILIIAIYEEWQRLYAAEWAKRHNYRNYLPPEGQQPKQKEEEKQK